MRYVMITGLALAALSTPVLAQDRTPPAGSLRALEVPADQSRFYQNRGDAPSIEGRSTYDGRAFPASRDSGYTVGR